MGKSKDNVSILIIRMDYHEVDGEVDHEIDFNEQEIKENDKTYNSASSNGSVGSALTQNENMNDSLQSMGSNQSQNDDNIIVPKKHKFHIVMVSDDNIGGDNDIDLNN